MNIGAMFKPKGGESMTSASSPFQERDERRGGGKPCHPRRRNLLIATSALTLLIVGCSLCTVMTETPDSDAFAPTYTVDGIGYQITNEASKEAWVTGTNLSTVVIPETIDLDGTTYKVVSIYGGAFKENKTITSVIVPASVTSIVKESFLNCTSLVSVELKGATSIGDWAFNGCYNLSSITFPESMKSIGVKAFYNCDALTSVTIHGSEASIGENAFCGCSRLETIDLRGVTSIGYRAFSYCVVLGVHNEITLQGVKTIGSYAFERCFDLTSITIQGSEVSIGDRAFTDCINLKSADLQGVTYLGMDAFSSCGKLKSLNMPDVKKIESDAFYECVSLNSVTIPDSAAICLNAFRFCTEIKEINFGRDVSLEKLGGFYSYPITYYFDVKCYTDENGNALSTNDISQFQGRTFKGDMNNMVRDANCNVTFDPDNGEDSWTNSLKAGSEISKPNDPVKEGYAFQGWVKADGTKFDFETEYALNMTLKAAWVQTFTVTYDTGTGKSQSLSCEEDSEISLPSVASEIAGWNPGHTLVGWSTGSEAYGPGASYTVKSNITFTAIWNANDYMIVTDEHFLKVTDGNGKEYHTNDKVAYGTELTVTANAVEGHEARIYWNGADITTEGKFSVGVMNIITVEYTPKEYAVTFDENLTVKNGGTAISSGAMVAYGTRLTVEATEREGYTPRIFLDEVVLTREEFTVGLKNNLTVEYAVIDCAVTFDENLTVKNGGTAILTGDRVAYGTELTVKAKEIAGKESKILLNGVVLTGESFKVSLVNNLTAKYDVTYYEVTFGKDLTVKIDGTPISTGAIVAYDTRLTVEAAEKTGKESKILLNGEKLEATTFTVTGNSGLTVEYTSIKCKVTFNEGLIVDVNGAEIGSGAMVDYGTELTVRITGKEGYEPLVILDTGEIGILKETTLTVTQDSTLFVVYIPKYEVTFDDGLTVKNNGAEIESGTKVALGLDLTVEAKEKEGHTSKIFLNGKELTNGKFTVSTKNILSMEYIPNEYTVNITVQGEGSVDSEELKIPYGTAASVRGNVLTIGDHTVTATPADKDHTFVGWSKIPTAVTSDVTITASFAQIFIDGKAEIETDTADIVAEKTGTETSIVSEMKKDVSDVDGAIKETLDKIAEVRRASGSSDEDITVRLIVPVNKGSERLTISAETVEALKNSGAELTVINGDTATSLDADAVETLMERAVESGVPLSIRVALDPSDLSGAQKKVVGENRAIDVSTFMGEKKVSDLGGKATISIPYVTDKEVKVTYVMDDGRTEDIACTYADGIISFVTTHFSVYMISEVKETVPVTPDTDDDHPVVPTIPTTISYNNDNTKVIIACVAAAVAAALAAIFFLVDPRRR